MTMTTEPFDPFEGVSATTTDPVYAPSTIKPGDQARSFSVDDPVEWPLLPDGVYVGIVDEAKVDYSKAGNLCLCLVWSVAHDGRTYKLWHYSLLGDGASPMATKMRVEMMRCVNVRAFTVDNAQSVFIGKQCRLRVRTKAGSVDRLTGEQYGPRNEISAYLPLSSPASQPIARNVPKDDELPF
jgi:hypothetical protein